MVLEWLDTHVEKEKNSEFYLISSIKINSRWIIDINV